MVKASPLGPILAKFLWVSRRTQGSVTAAGTNMLSCSFKLILLSSFATLNHIFVESALNQLCQQIDYFDEFKLAPECLAFSDYGCWCGPGGSGKPVDDIDGCCKDHDICYDAILQSKACSPYLTTYDYSEGKCLDEDSSCKKSVCKCDNNMAKCISKHKFDIKNWGRSLWARC